MKSLSIGRATRNNRRTGHAEDSTSGPLAGCSGKRAVIVGAGDAGLTVLRELVTDSSPPCHAVALVDDDSAKWGRRFYGVAVVGGTKDLATIAAQTKADQILICVPSANRDQIRRILSASRQSNLPVHTLPSLAELIQGRNSATVSWADFRSPQIEDLLQRETLRINPEETRAIVGGKTVLVTGAGGTIGAELCRQIAAARPRRLLLVDKSENSLFYVNLEMSELLEKDCAKPCLVDLLDRRRVDAILQDERPEIVFHAAAYKHVAMLEMHPQEAIRNNVLGTRNIACAALNNGVERFINISTDKAVDPRNYMGLSKKVAEMCIQELAHNLSGTSLARLSIVRFGNVAGSTGSVLRLFRDQIQKGGPVRVTDKRAMRYFMSVPEAVQLILRAAALGEGGETFVFDMGEPLNIFELAKTMMLFAGVTPGTDIPIEFTGLQKGEKLSEELWEQWENPVPSGCPQILVIPPRKNNPSGIIAKIRTMEEFLICADQDGLVAYLYELFPNFKGSRASACQQIPRAEALALATRVAPA